MSGHMFKINPGLQLLCNIGLVLIENLEPGGFCSRYTKQPPVNISKRERVMVGLAPDHHTIHDLQVGLGSID